MVNYADNVKHDASIEEIFHLITQHGYSNVYPTVFGESNTSTSTMAKAMDVARGSTTPQRKRWLKVKTLRVGITTIQTAQQQVL